MASYIKLSVFSLCTGHQQAPAGGRLYSGTPELRTSRGSSTDRAGHPTERARASACAKAIDGSKSATWYRSFDAVIACLAIVTRIRAAYLQATITPFRILPMSPSDRLVSCVSQCRRYRIGQRSLTFRSLL